VHYCHHDAHPKTIAMLSQKSISSLNFFYTMFFHHLFGTKKKFLPNIFIFRIIEGKYKLKCIRPGRLGHIELIRNHPPTQ
jgi:hypothetical protein